MLVRFAIVTSLIFMMGSAAFGQTQYDATYTQAGLGSMTYRVFLPADYDPNGPAIPVVLYLHSAAERGDTPDAIFQSYNNWVTPLIGETQTGSHQAILVMPESGAWQTWASINAGDNWTVGDTTNATQGPTNSRLQLAMNILDVVTSTKNADTNRIYVTGPSMGGYGTWDALARFGDKFAAGAPLSGGGNTDAASTALASKPIWMYHGAQDPLISATNTDALFLASLRAGGNPYYTRNATAEHDGWDTFYTPDTYTTSNVTQTTGVGNDFYDWLFSQSLDHPIQVVAPTKSTPYVVSFSNSSASSNMVIGTTADGNKTLAYNHLYQGSVANMNNMNAIAGTISIAVKSGTVRTDTGISNPGAKVSAMFPTSAISGSFYCLANSPLVFNITGLNDNELYTFDIFGASNSQLAGTTGYLVEGLNYQYGELYVAHNTNNILTLENIRSVNGIVTLTMSVESGMVAYLNALRITDVSTVPEPASISLLGLGAMGLLRRRAGRRPISPIP